MEASGECELTLVFRFLHGPQATREFCPRVGVFIIPHTYFIATLPYQDMVSNDRGREICRIVAHFRARSFARGVDLFGTLSRCSDLLSMQELR
jgi:hypothetical protein